MCIYSLADISYTMTKRRVLAPRLQKYAMNHSYDREKFPNAKSFPHITYTKSYNE